MREGAPQEVLVNVAGWSTVISSWLDGEVLAETVPILAGRITASADQEVPERLTFTVPRWDGRDWYPGNNPLHPLARFGQELDVQIVVRSAVTGIEHETRIGRFRIQSWSDGDDGGPISVEAVGRLQKAADDRLVLPLAPRASGTLATEFERLLPDGLTLQVDQGLTDRACPQGMEWAEDRLAALYEIADAWPARLRTDQWGQIVLLPPLPEIPAPIVTLTDGEGGTVVSVPRTDTRDQTYNRIVARAQSTEVAGLPPTQAVVSQETGPMSTLGPYGVVTKLWSSPLITTLEQARAAGQKMLLDSLRPSRTLPVTLVPDPRLDLDDPVEVWRDGIRYWGYITAYDLPLTVKDGAMRIDVAIGA